MNIELMKKVLAYTDNDDRIPSEINHILAQAIANAEKHEVSQEPVAWGVDWGKAGDIPCVSIIKRLPDGGIEVLACEYAPYAYTSPPKRQQEQKPCPFVVSTREGTHHCSLSHREPLTDEQIYGMYNEPRSDAEMIEFARAIEAAHGIGEKK